MSTRPHEKIVVPTTMRTDRCRENLTAMPDPIRVELEFHEEAPLAGSLTSADGRQSFTGWLGLMAALERVISRASAETTGPPPTTQAARE